MTRSLKGLSEGRGTETQINMGEGGRKKKKSEGAADEEREQKMDRV